MTPRQKFLSAILEAKSFWLCHKSEERQERFIKAVEFALDEYVKEIYGQQSRD